MAFPNTLREDAKFLPKTFHTLALLFGKCIHQTEVTTHPILHNQFELLLRSELNGPQKNLRKLLVAIMRNEPNLSLLAANLDRKIKRLYQLLSSYLLAMFQGLCI